MKLDNTEESTAQRVVAIRVDMVDRKWAYVIWFAIGWFFTPLLTIVSRTINKPIELGVFNDGSKEKS